ncbi:hypothetical protein T08_8634 [Trichinella sp. T8]|nr:hypothetical protein T08_8634 [Trichinella sp. T8]
MTDQAFVEGFHCPTAPSVPVVVATRTLMRTKDRGIQDAAGALKFKQFGIQSQH